MSPWPLDFEPIRRDFGYPVAADEAAARWLAGRLIEPPFDGARAAGLAADRIMGAPVAVLGGSESAPYELHQVPPTHLLATADGATRVAVEAGRFVDFVVTDLDGDLDAQLEAARRGAIVFVHAHGDNRRALQEALERFPPHQVAGTCQVGPMPPLLNPGGFTDGDRAVHLAFALGASEILLAGFDFRNPGPYSAALPGHQKRKKLEWAERLITRLVARGAPVRRLDVPAT